MSVISLINEKGGVGKTTSAICLSDYLIKDGYSVALVDADPRHSACDWNAVASENENDTPLTVGLFHENIDLEIKKLKENYDYVIVDSMSSFVDSKRSRIIGSLLRASDHIFIPVQPSALDFWATKELVEMIKYRQDNYGGEPKAYFYANMVRENVKLYKELREDMEQLPFYLLKNALPLAEAFRHTIRIGKTPLSLNPSEKSRKAVVLWAEEIMEKTK